MNYFLGKCESLTLIQEDENFKNQLLLQKFKMMSKNTP